MDKILENIFAFAGFGLALVAVYVLGFLLKRRYVKCIKNGSSVSPFIKRARVSLAAVGFALNAALVVFVLVINAGADVLLMCLMISAALAVALGGAV